MPSARSLADARLVLAKGPEAYDGTDASQPECICLVLDINPTQRLFETAFFFFFFFTLQKSHGWVKPEMAMCSN